MKKSLLTLGLAAICLSSNAFERVLYQQNFEKVSVPSEAGWTTQIGEGKGSITIASDQFGNYLDINNVSDNGRSSQVTWGAEIYLDKEGNNVVEDSYKMSFTFCINANGNNQYNSCISVFTNHEPKTVNQIYRMPWTSKGDGGVWENFILDITQCNTAVEDNMLASVNGPLVTTVEGEGEEAKTTYSIDNADAVTFSTGTWYSVECTVNVKSREVEYTIADDANPDDILISGTSIIPLTDPDGSDVSVFAEGMYVMMARYKSDFLFDNIKIYIETENAYANDPTVALTRLGQTADEELNLNMRAYTITFTDGETLHIVGTDGASQDIEFDECDGQYVYETTTSGVLKAWTTCEDATSNVVEMTVDCEPYVLPEATANISSVKSGYGKTYTITVDNSNVPLRPTIFITYEYNGVNGEIVTASDAASGVKINVSEEGSLKITTSAYGYESKTVTIKNDVEFAEKKAYDFARMSKEDIVAHGFPAEFSVLNTGNQSGFNCWTGRNRLYYISSTETEEVVNEDGSISTVAKTMYPFGFIAEDNTTNVIEYTVINNVDKAGSEEAAPNVDNVKDEIFEGLTIFPKTSKNSPWKDPYADTEEGKQIPHYGTPNVGIMYRIGLYNDQTINNNNNVIVHDLDESDFVVVNYINGYGSNSIHPTVATDEEYYAALAGDDAVYAAEADTDADGNPTGTYSVTYPLYRIDTCITKITIFKQTGTNPDAVEAVEAVAGDNNWYSIDGVRVAEPTRPGLYIHNGKKIIVK